MAPKTSANSRTNICVKSPLRIDSKPTVRHTSVHALMKMTPPIVGVPDFDMCHVGPFSFISCPAFIFLSQGT